jgi:hypothetical protein
MKVSWLSHIENRELLIIENISHLEPNSLLHPIERALHTLLLRADGMSLLLAIFVKDKWDWGKYYCDSSDE